MFDRNGWFEMTLRLGWLCCVLMAAEPRGAAATVLLRNSDRLTGKIEKLERKRLVLATAYAISPQNIEAISKPPVQQTFRSRISAAVEVGYRLTRGTSRLSQSSLTANAEYHSTEFRVQTDISSLFSKQAPAESESAHSFSTRLDFYLSPHAFVFTLGSLERDDREHLKLRSSLGGGLGWQIIDSGKTEISLLGGMTFVDESYRKGDVEQLGRREPSGEVLTRLSVDKLEFGRLHFIGKTSIYPSVLDRGRVRVVTSTGVRMPIIGHLMWTLRLFESSTAGHRLPSRKPTTG